MIFDKYEILSDACCIVGESPVWDDANNKLLMVDIYGKRFRSIDISTCKVSDTVLPQKTAFLILEKNGNILGGAEDGIYRLSTDGGFVKVNKSFLFKGERLNDGRVSPNGELFFGSFSRDYSAAFYKMDKDGNITELFDKVGNSNGFEWSNDDRLMYYNDTLTGRTDVFDYKNGELLNRRVFYNHHGNVDGMTIDQDGNLWTAVWGTSKVVCVSPNGNIIHEVVLPVTQVSSCAFIDSDLRTLAITTAAHGIILKDQPLAGSVFAVRVNVCGTKQRRIELSYEN